MQCISKVRGKCIKMHSNSPAKQLPAKGSQILQRRHYFHQTEQRYSFLIQKRDDLLLSTDTFYQQLIIQSKPNYE